MDWLGTLACAHAHQHACTVVSIMPWISSCNFISMSVCWFNRASRLLVAWAPLFRHHSYALLGHHWHVQLRVGYMCLCHIMHLKKPFVQLYWMDCTSLYYTSAVYTYYRLINFCLSVCEISPGDFVSLAYVNHALRLVPTSIHCINNMIIIEIIYMTVSYNIQVLQHVQYMMPMHGY